MTKRGYLGIVLERPDAPPGQQVETFHTDIVHTPSIQARVDHAATRPLDINEAVGALVVAHRNDKFRALMVLANWILQHEGRHDCPAFL
jgi:hypothetical protein